jgi:hypothetical protein
MSWLPFHNEREEVADRFVELGDGRTLFLPRGRGGPAYLVPDESTRLRLWRISSWAYRGGQLIAILLTVGAFRLGHIEVALGILGLALAGGWFIQQAAVGGLQPASDPAAIAATAPPLEQPSAFAATMGVVVGAGLVGAAVWVFAAYRDRMEIVMGVGLFGTMLLFGGLKSLRATHDWRPSSDPADNRPIVPR